MVEEKEEAEAVEEVVDDGMDWEDDAGSRAGSVSSSIPNNEYDFFRTDAIKQSDLSSEDGDEVEARLEAVDRKAGSRSKNPFIIDEVEEGEQVVVEVEEWEEPAPPPPPLQSKRRKKAKKPKPFKLKSSYAYRVDGFTKFLPTSYFPKWQAFQAERGGGGGGGGGEEVFGDDQHHHHQQLGDWSEEGEGDELAREMMGLLDGDETVSDEKTPSTTTDPFFHMVVYYPAKSGASKGVILEVDGCMANHGPCPCPPHKCPISRRLAKDPSYAFTGKYFNRSFGRMAAEDCFRRQLLNLDHDILQVWNCCWLEAKKVPDSPVAQHCRNYSLAKISPFPLEQTFSEFQIVEAIRDKRMRGFVLASIKIPHHVRPRYVSLYVPLSHARARPRLGLGAMRGALARLGLASGAWRGKHPKGVFCLVQPPCSVQKTWVFFPGLLDYLP